MDSGLLTKKFMIDRDSLICYSRIICFTQSFKNANYASSLTHLRHNDLETQCFCKCWWVWLVYQWLNLISSIRIQLSQSKLSAPCNLCLVLTFTNPFFFDQVFLGFIHFEYVKFAIHRSLFTSDKILLVNSKYDCYIILWLWLSNTPCGGMQLLHFL